MISGVLAFVLRMALITAAWLFIWRLVKPQTQTHKIARAALLVFTLLIVLAILRAAGA